MADIPQLNEEVKSVICSKATTFTVLCQCQYLSQISSFSQLQDDILSTESQWREILKLIHNTTADI